MTGTERRKKLLNLMRESKTPLSGGALGSATGVSRQVIVQDIALLRTEGYSILATAIFWKSLRIPCGCSRSSMMPRQQRRS